MTAAECKAEIERQGKLATDLIEGLNRTIQRLKDEKQELLEACRAALGIHRNQNGDAIQVCENRVVLRQLRAAIARAEGGEA